MKYKIVLNIFKQKRLNKKHKSKFLTYFSMSVFLSVQM